MKGISLLIILIVVIFGSWILYQQSIIQSSYNGLPTVPCIDTTLPIRQSYSFMINITINDKNFPLDSSIGHDYGNCLHDIFVKDSSGTVYVETNGNENFTLGNFFDVWHKTYNSHQIFGYQAANGHTIKVFVDGKEVETYDKTPISPNERIEILYQ